jgi:hypothetical protein
MQVILGMDDVKAGIEKDTTLMNTLANEACFHRYHVMMKIIMPIFTDPGERKV